MNYSAKQREKSFEFSEKFRRKGEVCEDADGMGKRCQQKFSTAPRAVRWKGWGEKDICKALALFQSALPILNKVYCPRGIGVNKYLLNK